MIRFIIKTVSSETDVNGNRYHFATVTSTKTGNILNLDSVGGDENAPHLVRRLLDLDWDEVWAVQFHLPKRQWQRSHKFHTGALYEHQIDAAKLKRLERKQKA